MKAREELKTLVEGQMSPNDVIVFFRSLPTPWDGTAEDLGALCYQYYSCITGLPERSRNEEGHFPDIIASLQDLEGSRNGTVEFQNGWNSAADGVVRYAEWLNSK